MIFTGLMALMLALYVLVGFGWWAFAETRLLYHPTDDPMAECPLPDGVEIIALGSERGLFTPVGDGEGSDTLVVFYHGNGSRACNWRFLGPNHLAPLGVDTLVVEYPGYADDPRTPSKAGLHGAAEAAHAWSAGRYDRVIAFGNSIGTGPASHHAGLGGVDRLVLFAPFDSMLALLRGKGFVYPRFVLSNDYDVVEAVGEERPDVVIVHGARDTLIPATHSADLATTLEAKGMVVTRILRPEAGHNGLFDDAFFDPFLVEHVVGNAAK